MKTYVNFGLCAASLEAACQLIARAVKIEFEERESDYWGIYYRYPAFGQEARVRVVSNYDAFENEWQDPDHMEFDFLVFTIDAGDEVVKQLVDCGCVQLRRTRA